MQLHPTMSSYQQVWDVHMPAHHDCSIDEAQSAVGPSLLGVCQSGIHCLSHCVSRLWAAETFVARWKLFCSRGISVLSAMEMLSRKIALYKSNIYIVIDIDISLDMRYFHVILHPFWRWHFLVTCILFHWIFCGVNQCDSLPGWISSFLQLPRHCWLKGHRSFSSALWSLYLLFYLRHLVYIIFFAVCKVFWWHLMQDWLCYLL